MKKLLFLIAVLAWALPAEAQFIHGGGGGGAGTGDVAGPGSSTDGHAAVFDGTDGKKIKDGGTLATDNSTASHLLCKDSDGHVENCTLSGLTLTGTTTQTLTTDVPTTFTTGNESTDTTTFPVFVTSNTPGALGPKTDSKLTYNSNTGAFSSTSLGTPSTVSADCWNYRAPSSAAGARLCGPTSAPSDTYDVHLPIVEPIEGQIPVVGPVTSHVGSYVYKTAEILLSTTTVSLAADADTTLYTVPAGRRCVLTKAVLVAAANASTTTISIGGEASTYADFIPTSTLSAIDAQYDVAILQPVPSTTPVVTKSYAAATVIKAHVASQAGSAGNTLYLFGFLY
jgi:hypothetical protein